VHLRARARTNCAARARKIVAMKTQSTGVAMLASVFVYAGTAALTGAVLGGACSNGGTGQGGGRGGAPGIAGSTGAAGTNGAAAASGAAGASGTNGGAGAAGTTGAAGTSPTGDGGAGVTGFGGSSGSGTSGGASGAAGASTGNGELAKGPFTCTTYIGSVLTTEWWGQGFETIVDNARWQLKWHHHGYIEAWGDPQSPFWADTGDPNNLSSGSPIQSACAQNSMTPDRVVFLAIDWVLLTEQDWIDWLEKDLVAIKLKYPSVRWIDIMPTPRCPNNMMCNPNAKPGPGANDGAGPEDCYIAPYIDSAIAKVVAAHAESVGLGPIVMATMCNGGYGAHLTTVDNKLVATAIGNFYKALP
jgi:hypothetical protein